MFLDKVDQMYLEGKPAFEHEFKVILYTCIIDYMY